MTVTSVTLYKLVRGYKLEIARAKKNENTLLEFNISPLLKLAIEYN